MGMTGNVPLQSAVGFAVFVDARTFQHGVDSGTSWTSGIVEDRERRVVHFAISTQNWISDKTKDYITLCRVVPVLGDLNCGTLHVSVFAFAGIPLWNVWARLRILSSNNCD